MIKINGQIKLVVFDLCGVVFIDPHMVSSVLMSYLPEHAQQPLVKKMYNKYTRGFISEASFWNAIGESENHILKNDFLNGMYLDKNYPIVMGELSKNYQCSILSNMPAEWGDYLVNKNDFKDFFSPIIISGKVGCEKPSQEIYKILIDLSGINPEEIIFIDDRLENLEAASKLGIKTIYLEQENDNNSFSPSYKISSLIEILDILLRESK